ncbi:MAG: hypothetical protein AMXMBFR84_28810 [Candidatus Hydrogenedentota bacterium]
MNSESARGEDSPEQAESPDNQGIDLAQSDFAAREAVVRSDEVPTARFESLADAWRINMSDSGETRNLSGSEPTSLSNPSAQSRMVRSDEPTVETIGTSDSFGSDPRDPLIGAQIQNYAIDGLLGEGGFGNVYHAVDEKLGRQVALKFLRNPMNEKHRSLFEREAKAIAKLGKHAHIVDIFAWGEFNDMNYFILEYVPTSLASLIKSNPSGIAVPTAVSLIKQCAEALAFAHDENIVHRDIKPANILLETPEGPAKITDFGLTRLMDSNETSLIGGGISGSPPYMSPEQACGEELDNRTDIFSLGVSLYELLTGKRPFEGKTPTEVINKVRGNNSVHITERRKDLPPALVQVVDKALEYNRDQRYQSAHDFARDLGHALEAQESQLEKTIPAPEEMLRELSGSAIKPEHAKKPRSLTYIGVAAFAAAVVLVGWVVLFGGGSQDNGPVAEANSLLNQGQLDAAKAKYESLAAGGNEDALYGLGCAQLLQNNFADAQKTFESITDTAKRTEGLAALAYMQKGASAKAEIVQYASAANTPYLKALEGMIAGNAEETAKALEAIQDQNFNFQWQKEKALQALGQAYVKLDELEKAEQIFASLKELAPANDQKIADAYLEFIQKQKQAQERAETKALVADVLAAMKANPKPEAPKDEWTSDTVRFYFMPVEKATAYAEDNGFTDLMPQVAGDTLASAHGLEMVNRAAINEILTEQTLSQLGVDKSKIGQFMSARFFVKLEFNSVKDKDYLTTRLVDVWTSQDTPVITSMPLQDGGDFTELGKKVAADIATAVKKRYPIQATLTVDANGNGKIDVGSNVGVREGMRFEVGSVVNEAFRPSNANAFAVVTSSIGDRSADVTIQSDVQLPAGKELLVREAVANS